MLSLGCSSSKGKSSVPQPFCCNLKFPLSEFTAPGQVHNWTFVGNVCDQLGHSAFLLKKKPGLGNIRQTHLGAQCSRARAGRKKIADTGCKRGGFLGVSPPPGGGELKLRERKALGENEVGENKDPPLQSVLRSATLRSGHRPLQVPAMGETFLRCPLRTPRGRVLVSLPPGGEFLLGTPEFVSQASGEFLRSFLPSRIRGSWVVRAPPR